MKKYILVLLCFMLGTAVFLYNKKVNYIKKNYIPKRVFNEYLIELQAFVNKNGKNEMALKKFGKKNFISNEYLLFQIVANEKQEFLILGCRDNSIKQYFKIIIRNYLNNFKIDKNTIDEFKLKRIGIITRIQGHLKSDAFSGVVQLGIYDKPLKNNLRKAHVVNSGVLVFLLLSILITLRWKKKSIEYENESLEEEYDDAILQRSAFNNNQLEETESRDSLFQETMPSGPLSLDSELDESRVNKGSSEEVEPYENIYNSRVKEVYQNNLKLENEINRLAAIREVGLAINSILDFKKMITVILNILRTNIDANKIVIYLFDKEEGGMNPYVTSHGDKIIYGGKIRDEENLMYVVDSRKPFISEACIIHPLIVKGKLIGIIKLEEKNGDSIFDSADMETLKLLTSHISIAINDAILYEKAITDGLTGLYVQRHFHHKLQEEINRSKRNQTSLSVIMLDLDHFKNINDTYGHQTGDFVLKNIAVLLKNNFRKTDFIFRYGGEEFSIILPETDISFAVNVAEKFRAEVESNVLSYNGNQLNVTVSIGVAEYYNGYLKDDLIKKADDLLYQAKNSGRNKVCFEEFDTDAEDHPQKSEIISSENES